MKILFIIIFFINLLCAGLINSVALTVNGEPVTLYDIDEKIQKLQVSKKEAIDIIIDKILYNQELKKNNIELDIFDIENYIKKLASLNGLTPYEFKNAISQQQDYTKFEEQLKKRILHEKLVRKISTGKLKYANDDDLKIYYQNHIDEFKIPSIIEVTLYRTKKRFALEQIKKNPLINQQDVVIKNLTINLSKDNISNESRYILLNSKVKDFSPIFIENKAYNMFYISAKKGIKTIPFKKVKNKIFQILMKQREDEFLKDYFTKLRLKANIIKTIKE